MEGLETEEEDLWGGWLWQPKRRPTLLIYHRHDDNRWWEVEIYIDILEFHGNLQLKEFLDWIANMDDILNFKEVLEDCRVELVATRFRGCASAWWQHNKLQHLRMGETKITSLIKLQKHIRVAFLPHNYVHLMYKKLQDLHQDLRAVAEWIHVWV